jgi:hypothetical protein
MITRERVTRRLLVWYATILANIKVLANDAARPAVGVVKAQVGANATAKRTPRFAWAAFPSVAVRCRSATDIAAGTAVLGITIHWGAGAVAADGSSGAVVDTRAGDARDGFVGRRRGAHTSAASAVENVGGEVGAMTAATGLPQGVAVISAGPAVRVVQQVAAHPAASGGRAADVISAGPADAAGVAVARSTGRQAL